MVGRYSLANLDLQPGQATSDSVRLPVHPYRQGEIVYSPPESELDATLQISAMTRGLALRLTFDATLEGPCARCLEDAQATLHVDSHEVHDEASGDPELISDFVAQEALDVESWAREAIGLEFPTRVVCDEACLGLCSICGANQNEGNCGCAVEQSDPRWEKLRELQLSE